MPILKILSSKVDLFVESIKNIKTVGAVNFTSKGAINKMMLPKVFAQADCVVEFGGGNGCITEGILEHLGPQGKLLSFEINERFCEVLRSIPDKRLNVVEDSAEYLEKYIQEAGFSQADAVISSIPLSLMPDELVEQILDDVYRLLKPGGKFVQIQYSLVTKKLLQSKFDTVSHSLTVKNIPPAFIIVCEKKG